nr:cytochrome P450 CYP82D47-like [Ipomoea batatas]
MDVMLEILEDAQISDFDADTINKATCLNLLIAGSDAISVTLTWALSLLLNNRAMLDKVQEELDTQIGRDRNVDESDIKNLVFLQAVVKETLRLYPPGPVNGLRSSLQDCTLSQGYHVPAGTRLVINIWKIQRDESIWPEPNEFQPERFLTTHKDIDVRGQNFELIPFGSGRRSCPGIQLSLQTLHISLATLLHCFDFALPSNERIDMSESAGLINVKATPLKVFMDQTFQFLVTFASSLCAFIFLLHYFQSRRRVAEIKGRSLPQPGGALPVIGHLHCLGGGKLMHKVLAAMADKHGPGAMAIKLGSHKALVFMDQTFQFLVTFASSLCAFIFLLHYFQSRRRVAEIKGRRSLPQPDGALPFIGHLHCFGGGKLMHKVLAAMADKHGPGAMAIKLGSHKALVISSWEMARECFTTHDKAFCDRPRIAASKLLGYDYAFFGIGPYGEYWRQMRKIVTLHLLSNRQVEMLKPIRASELEISIRELYELWVSSGNPKRGVMVDLQPWVVNLIQNISVRMIGGKRLTGDSIDCNNKEEARRCSKVITEFLYLLGVFVLSDYFPFLEWLDFQGHKKSMKRIAKELDNLVGGWLEEHKKRRISEEGWGAQDFMDVMLQIVEDNAQISDFDADTIIKATCLVQEELDTQIGRNRNVDESDIKNLVFLQAVIKETLRLYPPAQLSGMRSSLQDCTLSQGYHVPAGRRSCPGIQLCLQTLHISLSTLLHSFDFAVPSDEKIDMSESAGFLNAKATPLKVCLTPRLPATVFRH